MRKKIMNFDDIKKMLTTPSIGSFKCIELIEIIGIKDKEPPFNIFTLAIAQEIELNLINEHKITPKLIQLKKDRHIKFGIFKSILSIDDFLNKVKTLDDNQWQNSKQEPLSCGKLRGIPNIFTPASERAKNEFLGLLKNNFFDGSHLFEWFDESKEYVLDLIQNHHALMELSNALQNFLPIKIGNHSDRLGNFIIQIPCSSVTFKIIKKDKNNCQLTGRLSISPHVRKSLNLSGVFWRENNESIIDFQKISLALGENIIPFKQINGIIFYTIWDEDNQVICSGKQILPFLESINSSISIKECNQRIFKLSNGKEQRVNLSTQTSKFLIGKLLKIIVTGLGID